jgi:hypothetical protein
MHKSVPNLDSVRKTYAVCILRRSSGAERKKWQNWVAAWSSRCLVKLTMACSPGAESMANQRLQLLVLIVGPKDAPKQSPASSHCPVSRSPATFSPSSSAKRPAATNRSAQPCSDEWPSRRSSRTRSWEGSSCLPRSTRHGSPRSTSAPSPSSSTRKPRRSFPSMRSTGSAGSKPIVSCCP